jgi:hypothetical protein
VRADRPDATTEQPDTTYRLARGNSEVMSEAAPDCGCDCVDGHLCTEHAAQIRTILQRRVNRPRNEPAWQPRTVDRRGVGTAAR